MDHEYYQRDRSLSMKLHSSNSERLDTWVILNGICICHLFCERKKKQWEKSFPEKTVSLVLHWSVIFITLKMFIRTKREYI